MLRIAGTWPETPGPTGDSGRRVTQERRSGRFERRLRLPDTVDPATVSARFENGLLVVTLEKRAQTEPRRIAVTVA